MTLTSPEPVGMWWRGKVKLKEGQIIPIEKNQYNPFQHYFPAGVRTPKNEGTRSLPYLFLKVNASDAREVVMFCEQYGVLGEFSPKTWTDYASRIGEALRGKHQTAASPLERLSAENDRLRDSILLAGTPPLSVLARPMSIKQFQLAQQQLQETIEWIGKSKSNGNPKLRSVIQSKIEWRLREKMTMVRPFLSWDQEQEAWVTGWDAGSLESFLYLMLLYDCQGRGQIKVCPWCKKVFMADRPKMAYCSSTCGTNYRVTKHRRKKRGVIRTRKEKR